MRAMKQVAAVIGAGFVGKAHIEALRRLPVAVRGTLVSSGERSDAAAKALGLERGYQSVDEIAADPAVTAVHICTPNYVHFEQAAKLLRAGKHVLCEKPLAMDSRESATLVALAKETNRVGGVAHNLRYYPLCQPAKPLIESGHALAGPYPVDHRKQSGRVMCGPGHNRAGASQTARACGVFLIGEKCGDRRNADRD
jgi:predicted dehydrogenase